MISRQRIVEPSPFQYTPPPLTNHSHLYTRKQNIKTGCLFRKVPICSWLRHIYMIWTGYCCIIMTGYWFFITQMQTRITKLRHVAGPLSWASIHSAVRRLTAKSREVSKPRDWMLQWSYRSEIWQAPRQQLCRGTCQISERLEKFKPESRGFETSRDLAVRRLTA